MLPEAPFPVVPAVDDPQRAWSASASTHGISLASGSFRLRRETSSVPQSVPP